MLRQLTIVLIVALGLANNAEGMDTLVYLNAQRASLGLYPLLPDPHLQAKAEWAARQRSRRGMNGHLYGGRPVAGRMEGTARRNGRARGPAGELWGPEDVYACYQATGTSIRRQAFSFGRARYAGCASVRGPDGYWYYQINLR